MECRKLEITLVSAYGLPDIRLIGRMKVYARVSITGESRTGKKTPVDWEGETNPRWNFSVDYWVSESAVHQADIKVAIQLFCKKSIQDDGFIGEVNIPVKSLFDCGLMSDKTMSYRVSGTSNGRLNILYRFGESTVLVRKHSGNGFRWRNAIEVGLLVLGGAILMLRENDHDVQTSSRGVRFDENDDDDDDEVKSVYYDNC